MYVYVCVCVYVQNFFPKTKRPSILFPHLKVNVRDKLKWSTVLWIDSVGCLTPSPHVIELTTPRSLVQDFWFTLINKP